MFREVISIAASPLPLPANKSTAYTRMAGTVGYTIGFNTVELRVDRIEHNNASTGTMKLVLWAVENFTGRTDWRGTRVAEARLEECSENEYYSSIRKTASRNSPSAGTYTLILSLEACIGGKFVMEDYRVFDKRSTFTLDAKLLGSCGYTISNSDVELRVEKISHNFSGTTGTMKLVLWATTDGTTDGQWSGFKVGKVKLSPLENGYSYTNVTRTGTRKSVPSGRYRMILQLCSYSDNRWIQHDYCQFDGRTTL